MRTRRRETPRKKSEVTLLVEFIGIRNLIIIGVLGSLYFYSGLRNYYSNEMDFTRAFSPYYALHLHDGTRTMDNLWNGFTNWVASQWDAFTAWLGARMIALRDFFFANIFPIIEKHPVPGFILFGGVGFLLSLFVLFSGILLLKKGFMLILYGSTVALHGEALKDNREDMWTFDPRRKPSEEQLKVMHKNLERLVQRAPAMGGSVPKNADLSIRELAKRNASSEYNYRCVVYVMGPVKGTNFDNKYETPLALDQIKKVSAMMGQSAIYETSPLDLVILRSKKGTTQWEVEPSVAAVNLGKSYPLKVLERVMLQNRNYFMWDSRANKSVTGYGV
ncbi:hypothetical protein GF373_14580 [bacterium]|nr:hypothetical protein [bacterium]